MRRARRTWAIFGLCLVLGIAAVGWISLTVIRLDRAEADARRRAESEEKVRLALWRMESALSPLIAQESTRPYFHYSAFYPAERAYTLMFSEIGRGEILVPSPLLTLQTNEILLHFQFGPDGSLTSPQVPRGNMRDLAELSYQTGGNIELCAERLADFENRVSRSTLLTALSGPSGRLDQLVVQAPDETPAPRKDIGKVEEKEAEQDEEALLSYLDWNVRAEQQAQVRSGKGSLRRFLEPTARGTQEVSGSEDLYAKKAEGADADETQRMAPGEDAALNGQARAVPVPDASSVGGFSGESGESGLLAEVTAEMGAAPAAVVEQRDGWYGRREDAAHDARGRGSEGRPASATVPTSLPTVLEGAMDPLWIGDVLVLARQVSVNGEAYVQGCWLNWAALRDQLIASVADLLPQVDLEPQTAGAAARPGRLLAALPIQLVLGEIPISRAGRTITPIGLSLLLAWAGAVVAVVAAGVVLHKTMVLSERRAAFVSSVTHELRTPLTTFRMYTEMLADGMVRDRERRRQYLSTLQTEAGRLAHLVENVLAYARLEKGRSPHALEVIALGALVDRQRDRLTRHAESCGMTVAIDVPQDHAAELVCTDPSVVEQVLLNLVDNACKYARTASDKRIHVDASRESECGVLRVRDYGPGISPGDRRRLFRPFRKSAKDAAGSAPGVGLGLSLSRRLARSVGGDLRLDATVGDGACFVLTLPLSPTATA